MSVLMTILQFFGLPFGSEAKEPVLAVTNSIAASDVDTDISLSIENTKFSSRIDSDCVVLSGAFRALEIKEIVSVDKRNITLRTEGSLDNRTGTGEVALSAESVKCGEPVSAVAYIDMTSVDESAVDAADPTSMLQKAAKGMITMTIKKIPGVGGLVANILDSTINQVLQIKGDASNTDILNKLDEIQAQLDALSQQISAGNSEILKEMYTELNFQDFNTRLTTLQSQLESAYAALELIDKSDASEYTKFVRTAGLLSFLTSSESDIVKETKALSKYIDGSQISGQNEKGIFEKAFLFACGKSVFGGEASQIVAPYIRDITYTLSCSYQLMAIVLGAKITVYRNWNDISAAAETDSTLKAAIGLVNQNDIIANNDIHESLLDESNKNGISALYGYYFNDADNGSVIKKYNQVVMDNWFSFVRSFSITDGDITVDFVKLSDEIGCQKPADVGFNASSKKSSAEGMVEGVNNKINTLVYDTVTAAEIDKIITHVIQNTNGVFLDEEVGRTLSSEDTLQGILTRYGFELPESTGKPVFVVTSSKNYHCESGSTRYSSWEKYDASLTVNGYDPLANCVYSKSGSLQSAYSRSDTNYYNYHQDIYYPSNDSLSTTDCSFYYFSTAPYTIYTAENFCDFVVRVANGDTFFNKTVLLGADIDLTGEKYQNIWLTAKSGSAFRGEFDGAHHKITGLNDTAPGAGGLFRTLGEGAVIRDLTLSGVSVEGTNNGLGIGALAGRVTGYTRISGVRVESGSVSGYDRVGGIVGGVENGTLIVSECVNHADVTAGGASSGGILGASVSYQSQKIYLCENYGEVKAPSGSATGGIAGYLASDSADQAHTFHHCKNAGKVSGGNGPTGGIIGHLDTDSRSHQIYSNTNQGDISGGSTGGIVGLSEGGGSFIKNKNTGNIRGNDTGGILGYNEDDPITFDGSSNSGNITGASSTGGIMGFGGHYTVDQSYTAIGCSNSGAVTGVSHTGGLFGYVATDANHNFSNNTNSGEVVSTGGSAGGIVGYTEGGGQYAGNVNTANVTGPTAGGIVGTNEDDSCNFSDSKNSGNVKATGVAGGILAYTGSRDNDKAFYFNNCENNGDIVSENSIAGGICGKLDTDSTDSRFDNAVNNGTVSGASWVGGIIGVDEGGGYFINCSNFGEVISRDTAGGIAGYTVDDWLVYSGCANYADIKGQQHVGGMVGFHGNCSKDRSAEFDRCTNSGNITATYYCAGGMAGKLYTDSKSCNLTSCVNTGNITAGTECAGGMVGFDYGGGTISYCVNRGNVKANDFAGKMIGRIEDDRNDFYYNTLEGTVTANGHVGSTVGYDGKRKSTY